MVEDQGIVFNTFDCRLTQTLCHWKTLFKLFDVCKNCLPKTYMSYEIGSQTLKSLFMFSSFSELIYKEVMDLEERTKNGVIRGQPSPLG